MIEITVLIPKMVISFCRQVQKTQKKQKNMFCTFYLCRSWTNAEKSGAAIAKYSLHQRYAVLRCNIYGHLTIKVTRLLTCQNQRTCLLLRVQCLQMVFLCQSSISISCMPHNISSSSRSSKYLSHSRGTTSLNPSRNAVVWSLIPLVIRHSVINLRKY